jgi:hypothetical protein
MFIRGHLFWCVTHRLQTLFEKGFGRLQVAGLTQAHIDQVAELVDGPIQITSPTFDLYRRLISVPLFPDLALARGF